MELRLPILKQGTVVKTVVVPKSLKIMDDDAAVPNCFGVLRVLTDDDGDKRIVWDRGSLDQISDARATFDQLVSEGLVPYRVGIDGKATAVVMEEFDPFAEEIIFLPLSLVAGG
jgi:hypothetical protein